MNGDGRADVFSWRASDLAFMVSYSGTSAWTVIAHGDLDPYSTWLADMNGDGRADVFYYRASDGAWLVSYSSASGPSSDWVLLNHGVIDPNVTRFGDMTGDGKADVFTQGSNGQWERSAGGTSSWQVINGGPFQPTMTWVGDIDGDGVDDVVGVDGNFTWAVSYSGTSVWTTINNGGFDPNATQLVDLNGDGKADIFTVQDDGEWLVSYSGTGPWQLVNNGFLDPTRTWLADMNGDHHADLFSIGNLTQWNVSYSGSAAWNTVNNGYLPVDTPPPSSVLTSDAPPPSGWTGNNSDVSGSGTTNDPARLARLQNYVADQRQKARQDTRSVDYRGFFNHNKHMFAVNAVDPSPAFPDGIAAVSGATDSEVPFLEVRADFKNSEALTSYTGKTVPSAMYMTETWSVYGVNIQVTLSKKDPSVTLSGDGRAATEKTKTVDKGEDHLIAETDDIRFDAVDILRVGYDVNTLFYYGDQHFRVSTYNHRFV